MIAGPFDGSSTPTRRCLVVAAVAAALVLAACGGGGDLAHPPRSGPSSETVPFDANGTAPAPPVNGADSGGTVTVLIHDDLGHSGLGPLTMDPTGTNHTATDSVLSGLITRSLTQYVYDPASGSMVLVPDIATDLGTPNADFTQWTFTIRDGVRFEDGHPVTADDIAYGIKRSLDRQNFPASASYSTDYFLDGNSYKGPYLSGDQYAGVVVDGNTLTIKMARPFPDMPYWAALPAMGPIPQLGSDPATYWRHPLATGPYKIERYSPRKSLTLVRNDQWEPATDPGRRDYPRRYVFEFHQDRGRSETAILSDSPRGSSAVSFDDASAANRSRAKRRGQLTSGPIPCTIILSPDYRKITDIRVREALGYAYPYRQLLGDTALPGTTSVLPPGTPGREDYTVLDSEPGETNHHKARMLLRQAGYAPGDYPIKFWYAPNTSVTPAAKEQIVRSFHAAGFATHPRRTTFKEYFAVQDDRHAPVNVRFGGLCADWLSGSSWLPHLFASDGDGNNAFFSEPTIDASIKRIEGLPLDQQPSAWGSLDKQIMTDYYPGVVLRYLGVRMLHGANIGGMNDDPLYGMPTWKDIYVRH